MKVFISAGEPSGDQRGSEVLEKLRELSGSEVSAFGLGGRKLSEAGMELTRNMSDYAVMGFTEIAGSLHRFLELERHLANSVTARRPDVALLVDYPGFNMRLGRKLRSLHIPVVHYVAPQMWAWGSWRAGKLRRSCDLLLTLFNFEEDFFRNKGINAVFTGHPLGKKITENTNPGDCLGLLPGSRAQEVKYLLPPMIKAFEILRDRGIVKKAILGISDHLDPAAYSSAVGIPGLISAEGSHSVLKASRAALVCSGTATLETALHGVPFVICYKTGSITYSLAKLLVRGVNRIGMANIVAGRDVAPELIQREVTPEKITQKISPLLEEGRCRNDALDRLAMVRQNLGEGDPAENAALEIIRFTGGDNGQ